MDASDDLDVATDVATSLTRRPEAGGKIVRVEEDTRIREIQIRGRPSTTRRAAAIAPRFGSKKFCDRTHDVDTI
jgi:hypothetical protein